MLERSRLRPDLLNISRLNFCFYTSMFSHLSVLDFFRVLFLFSPVVSHRSREIPLFLRNRFRSFFFSSMHILLFLSCTRIFCRVHRI